MASDEEDDLEVLRLAALATLKKKPAVVEDVQPIPQLTSSGHSLHKSNSPWTEDFSFDNVPFPDPQPIPQFQPPAWDQPQATPPEYRQGSPTHYSQNNWRGRGGQGRFQRPFIRGRGRGGFPPNQRAPFGQNQPPFGPRGSFNRGQRPFAPGQPFNPAQRPPFGQNPMSFSGVPPRGGGGGGGNLIVINTLPAEGEQPPRPQFPGQRMPFQGGPNNRGRGGRGGAKMAGGPDGNAPPTESPSKPMLLRPQDKYCPSAADTASTPEPAAVRRKKKDKFSRYDSSGSESDDESEEDSEEEQPTHHRRQSLAADEEEAAPADNSINTSHEEQPLKDIADAEISISAVNTSQLDSDKETEDQGLEELEEPVVDNFGEGEEAGEDSEEELNEEEEAKLLAPSPSRDSEVRSSSPHSPEDKRQSSVEKEPSPTRESPPADDGSKHEKKSAESDVESSSENNSESGNESDTSSSGSSSGSEKEEDSDAGSNSEGESENNSEQEEDEAVSVGGAQSSNKSDSDSESEPESSIRRLPAKRKVSTSPKRSPPKKQEVVLTPEEQARLEARRRKFENSQEVTVAGNKRTISLKGIVPKSTKKSKPTGTGKTDSSARPDKQSVRTMQARTSVPKTSASDSHRKHARRKVSIEQPPVAKSASDSEAENESESEEEEDEEENGSRSWRHEANKNPSRRKPVNVDQPLSGSRGGYRGNSYRDGSRNGGYSRQGYGAPRDTNPEVHYSSSSEEESDRKLISVVVPRSTAGTRITSGQRRGERDKVSNRKRTVSGGDESKSKRFPDSEGSGSISVVISGDPSAPKRSRQDGTGSRVPVHARLGKGSTAVTDSRSGGRSKARTASRKKPRPESEDDRGSNNNELDLRIRRIKKNNAAILRRQEEIQQDRELYG